MHCDDKAACVAMITTALWSRPPSDGTIPPVLFFVEEEAWVETWTLRTIGICTVHTHTWCLGMCVWKPRPRCNSPQRKIEGFQNPTLLFSPNARELDELAVLNSLKCPCLLIPWSLRGVRWEDVDASLRRSVDKIVLAAEHRRFSKTQAKTSS